MAHGFVLGGIGMSHDGIKDLAPRVPVFVRLLRASFGSGLVWVLGAGQVPECQV